LKATSNYEICFGENFDCAQNQLIGFCNSDYAADMDTKKSRSGYVFFVNGGAVAWASSKQGCVATSSTEVECAATKQAVWLRSFLADIHCVQDAATTLKVDNQ
jgi:hypothetical protein